MNKTSRSQFVNRRHEGFLHEALVTVSELFQLFNMSTCHLSHHTTDMLICIFNGLHKYCYTFMGARRIFSRGGQIRGLGTEVPQGIHGGGIGGNLGAKPPAADERL